MNFKTSFFNPKSIAVIGASAHPGKVGYEILKNIIDSGYVGNVVPVNPKEHEINGLKCFKDIKEAGGVELAIISVPASVVPKVVEECGEAGVLNIVIISAGFKEIGKEGAKLERRVAEIARSKNMRILGPNCLGVMDMYTPLNATFAGEMPERGRIAVVSQSGALLTGILDWSMKNKIGFSRLISLGNKSDLNETDFIEALVDDENTRVILCYIESIDEGQHFVDVAKKVSRKKPLIILKSGTGESGTRAASSHTGALAGSDIAYTTAFREAGVIRASTLEELFDLARIFVSEPVPGGSSVGVVTNAGGPGILSVDAVDKSELQVAKFGKETIDRLRQKLPSESNVYNPVDVVGDAKSDRYAYALDTVLLDPNVNSALVILTPQAMTEPYKTAKVVVDIKKKFPDKPIATSYIGGLVLSESIEYLEKEEVPNYAFPESGVRALAGLVKYSEYIQLKRDESIGELSGLDKEKVKSVLESIKKDGRNVLLGSESSVIMEAYGIPVAKSILTDSPRAAVRAADSLGYPVVMKVASPRIQHKSDVGGVRVNVKDSSEVKSVYNEILDSVYRFLPGETIYGIEVQEMKPQGRELIIGMNRDIQFGPLVMFGLGGIYVNLLKDVSFRLANYITPKSAFDMIGETRAYMLLKGFRGESPSDIESVVDVILRISKLALDFQEIVELDINPLFAYEHGVAAVDIKMTISWE
ncbi:succinyl-CoA synthetase subunit alpha [archaeon]|nr:succinyl-CoA synthetase subunit alpha [archaeon]